MSPVSTVTLTSAVNGSSNIKHNTHIEDQLDSNIFHRVWRGDKEGKVTLKGVPKFENKYEEREWIKVSRSSSLGRGGFC
jgi:hypothetical protein